MRKYKVEEAGKDWLVRQKRKGSWKDEIRSRRTYIVGGMLTIKYKRVRKGMKESR